MADTYRIRIRKGNIEIEAEGDKGFVEKHIEGLKKEMLENIEQLLLEGEISVPIAEIQEKIELENLSLAEFYRMKKPKDHNETIVVFAYWLSEKEKREETTPKDIEKCYNKIGVKKPANIPDVMKKLASGKKAYLIKTEKRGIYKISMLGKDLIEKGLSHDSEK